MLMSNLLLLPAGILGKLQEQSVFGYQVEMRAMIETARGGFPLMNRAICDFECGIIDKIDLSTRNAVFRRHP